MGRDIATMQGIFGELERRRRVAVFELHELGEALRRPADAFGSPEVRAEVIAMERTEAEIAVDRFVSQWNDGVLSYFAERRRADGWSEEQIEAALGRHRKTRTGAFDWPE